jgi:hypothetical protein
VLAPVRALSFSSHFHFADQFSNLLDPDILDMLALFSLAFTAFVLASMAPVEAVFNWQRKPPSNALPKALEASDAFPKALEASDAFPKALEASDAFPKAVKASDSYSVPERKVFLFYDKPWLSTDQSQRMKYQFLLKNTDPSTSFHCRGKWSIYAFSLTSSTIVDDVEEVCTGKWLKVPTPDLTLCSSLEPLYPFMLAFTFQIKPTRKGFAFKLVSEENKEESELFYMRDGIADVLHKRRIYEMARQALIEGKAEILDQLAKMSHENDKEIIDRALKTAAGELFKIKTSPNLIDDGAQ